ncbi:MAG: class I SAM-dependent methyltransferase [Fimbriimonadaceae bacterium]
MSDYPEHVLANRHYWSEMSDEWVEPGRKSWLSPTITWGIWGIPESEVGAFGDLSNLRGKDTIELGCGTAYFSAWMAKHGARPVGIDITPNQLTTARRFQAEFGLEFPVIEASAEAVPLNDATFDVAISEYGASIWCDPDRWVAEASRLLRPGGRLIFLRNSTVSVMCTPMVGAAASNLIHSQFGMYRQLYPGGGVEFHIPHGDLVRLLRRHGFVIENLIELQAPEGATSRYDYMTPEWARQWPSEEIWVTTKA